MTAKDRSIALERVDITTPKFKANPFPTFKHWRETKPVVPVGTMNGRTWIITRYDDVQAALSDPRLVKNRNNVPNHNQRSMWMPGFIKPLQNNLLEMDVPDHTRLRSLVHQAFMPRLIARMQTRIEELAHAQIDRLAATSKMDLIRDFALPIPLTAISEMLGVDPRDRAAFGRWSNTAVSITKPSDGIIAIPSLYQLVRFLRRLLRERRLNPQDDLLSALLRAEDNGSQLADDEIIGTIALLLSAGHETTVNLIGNGVVTLLEQPAALDRLRQEPELIKPAIEELVRFNPPVLFATPRYATEDLEIAGTVIPKGELVLAGLGSANHDEAKFDRPEILILDRANNKHLGFGAGMHYCLGAPLARLETTVAFQVLFERLPDLRLAIPSAKLRWNSGLVTRGMVSIPIEF